MPDAYTEKYARCYDLLYGDKAYETECEFVETIFRNYLPRRVQTILELGCGTGGHAIPLARRGYAVTGIDASDAMVAVARGKAQESGLTLGLQQMDIRQFDLDDTFDACICMFNVIGYITENRDIQSLLKSVRRHLKEDSLFVFDCWNGLAVLRLLPSVTTKKVADNERKITRIAQPKLDAFQHLCEVNYQVEIVQGNTLEEINETHLVRFFFPQEMKHYLEETGFKVLKICPFLNLDGIADENEWNISFIAKIAE